MQPQVKYKILLLHYPYRTPEFPLEFSQEPY